MPSHQPHVGKFELSIHSVCVFFLFRRKHFVLFRLNDVLASRSSSSSSQAFDAEDRLHVEVSSLSGVEYEPASKSFVDKKMAHLNYHQIKLSSVSSFDNDVEENDHDDQHVLVAIKRVRLEKRRGDHVLLLLASEITCTWSFRLHYIMHEAVLRPLASLLAQIDAIRTRLRPTPPSGVSIIRCSVETSVRVCVLVDYGRDSSKRHLLSCPSPSSPSTTTTNSRTYYDLFECPPSKLVHAVAIVLTGVYIEANKQQTVNSNHTELSLIVDETTMFADTNTNTGRRRVNNVASSIWVILTTKQTNK